MNSSAAELQKALFAALAGDAALTAMLGGEKIFDHAPADVRFPYVTFGRTSFYDWSTSTESGTEQFFTLHVWSKAKGKKETLAIMDEVRSRLDEADMALASHDLVGLSFETGEVSYDEDVAVHHGVLRFRAVMDSGA